MTTAEIKAYLKEIERSLTCPGKAKKRIMEDLKKETAAFAAENPDAGKDELIILFGAPEEIAACANAEAGQPAKGVNLKKAILCALTVALALYAAFIVISLVDVHTEAHGYFESGILMLFPVLGVGV